MALAFDVAASGEVPVRSQSDVSREELITSAISWGAIIAGAVAATAATVILLVLGTGVGLSIVSRGMVRARLLQQSAFRRWCG